MRSPFIQTCAFFLCTLSAIGFAGCESPEPQRTAQPGSPEAPPPPTPEEVAAKASEELGLENPLPQRGARLPAGVRQNILQRFREKHADLSSTPEGKAALRIVESKLEDRIRALERNESWEHLLTMIDAHRIFAPESKKFEMAKENALTELRKPHVRVKGLPEFDGRKVAWLEIYTPINSETFDVRMSRGEEMHGIKLIDFFGQDKGVEIEYSETGERAVIYLPGVE